MKHLSRLLLLASALLLIMVACKKDKKIDDGTEPPPPPPPPPPASTTFPVKDVQVSLPTGSTYDLTGSQLLSLADTFPVAKDGKTKAANISKGIHITYVFDKSNTPILAGFINDSIATISAATTAKVLLYHAYGIEYRPDTVTDLFINHIEELKGVQAWMNEFTELWKNDPLILSKGTFAAPLRTTMEKLKVNRNPVDVHAKTSDINVDNGDFLSGIQLFQESLGKLSFNNHYRRRAHAFLYKMKSKDMHGNAYDLITDINSATQSTIDLPVEPASANTSITGQIATMWEGKGDEIFMMKSGPVTLDLLEAESEATYKVRVVGPGVPYSKQPVTNAEISKQTRLEVETFALDFMFPVIMEIFGWKDELKKSGINPGSGPVEDFIDKTELFLKAAPDVYAEVKAGNYQQAVLKAVISLHQGAFDKEFEGICLAVASLGYQLIAKMPGVNVPPVDNDKIKSILGKAGMVMKVVNTAMLGGDFIRILYGVTNSHQLEEWEVVARASKVSLLPKESKVSPTETKKITAEIKNMEETGGDTHPFFEWSTSGKYGQLKDTKGHQGSSFASADKDVNYVCTVSPTALGDGDNYEYIYVKALMGSTVIGYDTCKINVRKIKYKMMPNNVTLSGKENAHNEVRLYLQRADGTTDIKPNANIDYKVVWTTAGQYGGLSSKDIDNAKTVTEYDDNASWYSCTDDEVKEAKETITARIYAKAKNETSYRLFDEVTGTVNINNDPKKRVIHLQMGYLKGAWKEGNWYCYPYVVIPVDSTAKSYSARRYNFTGTSTNVNEAQIISWAAGKRPSVSYPIYSETNSIQNGNYYLSFGRTWCSGSPSGCNSASADNYEKRYKELYGNRVMVEVTYYY